MFTLNEVTQPRLINVPISRLNPIAHGVRKTNGVDIATLAASIAAEGLLQNLTVVADPDSPLAGADEFQNYQVIAGSRRLRALRHLVETKQLPADYEVPCRVIEEGQALSASLAENAIRENMHPADEFTAFRDMIEAGKSIEDIAARFGVTPLVVQRRLRLANVAPKLFELFRTDLIKLDQMMALALTDDHTLQLKAWGSDKSMSPWQRSAEQLRKTLTRKEIDLEADPVAKFVGRQEYERAGGVVHSDLFSDTGGGYVTDLALLQSLAAKKLEQAADQVRKESWSWVEVRESVDYAALSDFQRAQPDGQRKLTDVEKKLVNELTAERNKIDARLTALDQTEDESADAECEKLSNRREEIYSQLQSLDDSRTKWDPKILAQCGAIVSIENGKIKVHRGLAKGKLRQAKDAKAAKGGASTAAKPGHSEALTRELTAHVTFAIAAELIAHPGMAIIALTHKLALGQFYPAQGSGYFRNAVKIKHDVSFLTKPTQLSRAEGFSIAPGASPDLAKIATERKELQALLPKKQAELFGWLIKAEGKIVTRVLAFCVAESVDAVSGSEKEAVTQPLADALSLNMATRWTAGADNYLSRVGAAQIRAAMVDAGVGKTDLASTEKMKKAELVNHAQPLLANWVPKFMRFAAK